MINKFVRLEKLIGVDKFLLLNEKKILVIGVGGVGGYVVEGLVRSGICNITIIDFDVIDSSNINRQIIALESTIGMKKVDVLKNRILDINSDAKVDVFDVFLDSSNIKDIVTKDYDYVIDACDSVATKKELISHTIRNKIKLISSMGTARKMDPLKLEIVDIRKTYNDPLARILRKYVVDEKISKKVMVLSSTEVPKMMDDSTLGSTAFVPSCAGLIIASYVVDELIK